MGRGRGASVPGVLYVINDLGTGGAERSLAELLPRVSAGGFHPVVAIMFQRPEGVEHRLAEAGFDIRVVGGSSRRGRTVALRRLIRDVEPAIVHTTNVEADIAGRVAAWRTGVPVLTSLVSTSYDRARLADPAVRTSRVRMTQVVDAVTGRLLTARFHAITHAVKAAAIAALRLPPERITVIERGRDTERLGTASAERRSRVRAALGLAPAQQVILHVGRQEFAKGQVHLLHAMARLARREQPPLLLIAGRRGASSAELDRVAAALGIEANLRFLGHREDVPDLLAAADVFAFPSLYEGQGGALIEAMALRLPIVASDLPAIREVVADGCAADLVPPGDPVALADRIDALLTDRALADGLAQRARRLFLDRFTLDASASRMLGLYEEMLPAGAGRP